MRNTELNHFLNVVRRRWLIVLIVCAGGFGLLPIVAAFLPAHTARAQLLIVSQALKDTTLSDPDLPSIVTSTEVLSRVIKRLSLSTTPTALSSKIKTKLPPKSSILELSYKDTDGVRAANITNAIADEATSYFHEIAMRGYTDVLKALNARIAESRSKIAAADRLLQHASASNGFASSDKALDDLSAQIADLRVQRGQVAASLAADQATALALRTQLHDIDPIVRGEILQKDPVYQQVEANLAKDEADLISERASFRTSFPGLHALEQRISRERQQLQSVEATAIAAGAGASPAFTQTVLDAEHADGLVAADQQRLHAIDAELAAEQNHLQQVAGAGAVVGTLRAERDATLGQYVALTQRLSAAQGDAAQAASLGTLVVVSRAIPGSSQLPIWLFGLAFLIVLVAIGAAYAFDAMDRRLWSPREIEALYGRPVLSQVGGRS
ncbi:MAG: hypothetical protein WCE83_00885 [Candidatus Baltobacteraceae bacterium]